MYGCMYICMYVCCMHVPYSLNLSRVKTFADFAGFSQSVKVLTLKHFSQNNYYYVALLKYFSLKIMSLLKYFNSILPHPNGPLSQSVRFSSIAAASKAVEGILSPGSVIEDTKLGTQHPDRTRGSYEQFTAEEKERIGKRAAEHGVASTVRYFNKVFSDRVVRALIAMATKAKKLIRGAKKPAPIRESFFTKVSF